MPVIVGALGMIKEEVPSTPTLYEIQRIALCGTGHLFKVLPM